MVVVDGVQIVDCVRLAFYLEPNSLGYVGLRNTSWNFTSTWSKQVNLLNITFSDRCRHLSLQNSTVISPNFTSFHSFYLSRDAKCSTLPSLLRCWSRSVPELPSWILPLNPPLYPRHSLIWINHKRHLWYQLDEPEQPNDFTSLLLLILRVWRGNVWG